MYALQNGDGRGVAADNDGLRSARDEVLRVLGRSRSVVRHLVCHRLLHHLLHTLLFSGLHRDNLYNYFFAKDNDTHLPAIFRDILGKPVPEWILMQLRMTVVVVVAAAAAAAVVVVVVTAGAVRCAKHQSNHHHQHTNNRLLDRMPFLSPKQQCQSTELGGNITIHGLAYPKLNWGGVFQSCL